MNKEEDKKYPIGGHAPGNYYCRCRVCGVEYRGDKRSFQCEKCGEQQKVAHEHLIDVLDFVTNKYSIGKSAQELFNEYLSDQIFRHLNKPSPPL